jgi:hypothetical protein
VEEGKQIHESKNFLYHVYQVIKDKHFKNAGLVSELTLPPQPRLPIRLLFSLELKRIL